MPGDGRPVWAVAARVDSSKPARSHRSNAARNSAKWLNVSGGGVKIGLQASPDERLNVIPGRKPAPNRSE
jgi:hypothetical protein